MKDIFVKYEGKSPIRTKQNTECPVCAGGLKPSKRYHHPVYGDPEDRSLVTAWFSTRKTLEELGIPVGGKILSIGV